MKAGILGVVIWLVLSALPLLGADASDRFKGGSYDGWAQQDSETYASLMPPPSGVIIKTR